MRIYNHLRELLHMSFLVGAAVHHLFCDCVYNIYIWDSFQCSISNKWNYEKSLCDDSQSSFRSTSCHLIEINLLSVWEIHFDPISIFDWWTEFETNQIVSFNSIQNTRSLQILRNWWLPFEYWLLRKLCTKKTELLLLLVRQFLWHKYMCLAICLSLSDKDALCTCMINSFNLTHILSLTHTSNINLHCSSLILVFFFQILMSYFKRHSFFFVFDFLYLFFDFNWTIDFQMWVMKNKSTTKRKN